MFIAVCGGGQVIAAKVVDQVDTEIVETVDSMRSLILDRHILIRAPTFQLQVDS